MLDFIFHKKRKKQLTDLISKFNEKNKYPGYMALFGDNTIRYFLESSNMLCLHWYEKDDCTHHKFDAFIEHKVVWERGNWYVYALPHMWDKHGIDASVLLLLEDYLLNIVPSQLKLHEDLINSTKKYGWRCRIYEFGKLKLYDVPLSDMYSYIKEDIKNDPVYAEYVTREMDNEVICYNGFLCDKTAPENLMRPNHRVSLWTRETYIKNSEDIDDEVSKVRDELIRIYDKAVERQSDKSVSSSADPELIEFIKNSAKHARATIRRRSAALANTKKN